MTPVFTVRIYRPLDAYRRRFPRTGALFGRTVTTSPPFHLLQIRQVHDHERRAHCSKLVRYSAMTARQSYMTLSSINAGNVYINHLECGPMPNMMATLPNIGGALCSTPQSLAGAHY